MVRSDRKQQSADEVGKSIDNGCTGRSQKIGSDDDRNETESYFLKRRIIGTEPVQDNLHGNQHGTVRDKADRNSFVHKQNLP